MRKCLIVSVLGLCGVCLTCGLVASLIVWPRFHAAFSEGQDSMTADMARELTLSVSLAITHGTPRNGVVVLHETDLSLGYGMVFPDQPGMPTLSPDDAIYGFVLKVTSTHLTLLVGRPDWAYLGVPVVVDGRIELTGITAETPMGLLKWYFPSRSFEVVVETGLNDGLAAHDLAPVSLTLAEGSLTITTRPAHVVGTPTVERAVRTPFERARPF